MSDEQQEMPLPHGERISENSEIEDMEALRNLLFKEERQQISGIETRLKDPALHAQDVSNVLPLAVRLATAKDKRLTKALTPSVEEALKESVRRDPATVANAIFPILGPGIRKAIAETFSRLIQSLNQALEHSFSWQGLKWRVEAWRTGKSFAEVVLVNTLVYRVEQVFLIHKKTSLLLQHRVIPSVVTKDGDLVSSMLKAIQDFVHDSFETTQGDTLQTMQVGGVNVWIESGPTAVLALVIRGHPNPNLRQIQQNALEEIHQELSGSLESFEGDITPFELAGPALESCLLAQFGERPKKSSWKMILLVVVLIVAVGWWGYRTYQVASQKSQFLQAVKSQKGTVVTEFTKENGKLVISGLKDPAAPSSEALIGQHGYESNRVEFRWHPFHSLDPEMVLERAKASLQPPPNVSVTMKEGVLTASGTASAEWISQAQTLSLGLSGVSRFDSSGLINADIERFTSLQDSIENTIFYFSDGTDITPGQEQTFNELVSALEEFLALAAQLGQAVQVTLTGHSDASGTIAINQEISSRRAFAILNLLQSQGLDPASFKTLAAGASQPLRPDLSPEESSQNRRVTFHVSFINP